MLFNSIGFLVFFPIVVSVYLVFPAKYRYIWLLVTSYYFYMCWNPKYVLLIAISTVITYITGRLIEKKRSVCSKRMWLSICLISNLAILALFKYINFFITNISALTQKIGIGSIDYRLDLLLPVGISFYTFQAIGYTLDVYRGEIKAEKNILKYALFVSFFPQLVAGPIERSKNLLPQICNIEKLKIKNFQNIVEGLILMLWGFFQKLVIADRISILVNQVYDNFYNYGFVEIGVAGILFAFQIYCDFGGYSDIARGAAKVMGITLMHNFRQPYLAVSVKDFWKRWHISLTSWFTDYLYIPLGGNRKGKVRQYLNICIVFLISGFWHGAQWNFVIWGGIHAVFQVIGRIKNELIAKRGIGQTEFTFSKRIRKIVTTFILVDFAWIFFAAKGFRHAMKMIKQMAGVFTTTGILGLYDNSFEWVVLIFGLIILVAVDILHEKKVAIMDTFNKQESWFRGGILAFLLWSVILLGVFGEDYTAREFIYFQF